MASLSLQEYKSAYTRFGEQTAYPSSRLQEVKQQYRLRLLPSPAFSLRSPLTERALYKDCVCQGSVSYYYSLDLLTPMAAASRWHGPNTDGA